MVMGNKQLGQAVRGSTVQRPPACSSPFRSIQNGSSQNASQWGVWRRGTGGVRPHGKRCVEVEKGNAFNVQPAQPKAVQTNASGCTNTVANRKSNRQGTAQMARQRNRCPTTVWGGVCAGPRQGKWSVPAVVVWVNVRCGGIREGLCSGVLKVAGRGVGK